MHLVYLSYCYKVVGGNKMFVRRIQPKRTVIVLEICCGTAAKNNISHKKSLPPF